MTNNIQRYLAENPEALNTIMEGTTHFGETRMNELTGMALEQKRIIEFYYATDQDMVADKLSFRIIDKA
jgi:hypothetical protein